MSPIQPVGMDCKQCSREILLTKVSGFLNNQAGFIKMYSAICPYETLKVWAVMLHAEIDRIAPRQEASAKDSAEASAEVAPVESGPKKKHLIFLLLLKLWWFCCRRFSFSTRSFGFFLRKPILHKLRYKLCWFCCRSHSVCTGSFGFFAEASV